MLMVSLVVTGMTAYAQSGGAAGSPSSSSGRGRLRVAKPKGLGLTFRQLAERWVNGDLAKQHPGHIKVKRA